MGLFGVVMKIIKKDEGYIEIWFSPKRFMRERISEDKHNMFKSEDKFWYYTNNVNSRFRKIGPATIFVNNHIQWRECNSFRRKDGPARIDMISKILYWEANNKWVSEETFWNK